MATERTELEGKRSADRVVTPSPAAGGLRRPTSSAASTRESASVSTWPHAYQEAADLELDSSPGATGGPSCSVTSTKFDGR